MAEAIHASPGPPAAIRKVELDRPWLWLAKGWEDLRRDLAVGLLYGVLAAVTGYLVTLGLWSIEALYLFLPLTAGFLIVGPILAVGLYEVSRRRETGLPTTFFDALAAFRRNATQIALMGVALLLLMFLWVRVAALLFMLYFGYDPPSVEQLFAQTFLDVEALPFLIVGTGVGGLLAFTAFAISAVSIPMLLDRPDTNVIDAVTRSFEAVQLNFATMLFWAVLIVAFTLFGLVTLYLGLVLTLPLLAHASWHAYRDLVEFSDR